MIGTIVNTCTIIVGSIVGAAMNRESKRNIRIHCIQDWDWLVWASVSMR